MSAPVVEEIDTQQGLAEHLSRHDSLRGCVLQSIDLTELSGRLARMDLRGALFLGCTFAAGDDDLARRQGGLVFPRLPELPFDPYQPRLYTVDDLYDAVRAGGEYAESTDARIYAWNLAQGPRPDLAATLATSLHDHAISDALDEWSAGHADVATIGLMGGHAALRGTPSYVDAARLAALLTRAGRLVLTGGGPGAMEAGNLGAWMAQHPDDLDEAIHVLATVPDFHADLTGWARTALEVRHRFPGGDDSLGIPTWFYGHEPPNLFATHIGKYFSNAIREDTLLQRCRGGIVYLPGAAGTVQEVFQAATGNYYAAPGAPTTPMVLVGVDHWTRTLPAWPLLEALGRDRAMGAGVHLVDSLDEAAEVLLGNP